MVVCKKTGNECYGLKELELLFDVSQRLIQSKELKNDLSAILEMLVRYLDAERSFLTIFNRESESILIEAAYGYSAAQQARGRYKLGEGIIGRVVEMSRPLCDRRNDIPSLVDHFIEKFNKRNNSKIIRITTSALNMLMVYSWPGNIRELENCIERSCIPQQRQCATQLRPAAIAANCRFDQYKNFGRNDLHS